MAHKRGLKKTTRRQWHCLRVGFFNPLFLCGFLAIGDLPLQNIHQIWFTKLWCHEEGINYLLSNSSRRRIFMLLSILHAESQSQICRFKNFFVFSLTCCKHWIDRQNSNSFDSLMLFRFTISITKKKSDDT